MVQLYAPITSYSEENTRQHLQRRGLDIRKIEPVNYSYGRLQDASMEKNETATRTFRLETRIDRGTVSNSEKENHENNKISFGVPPICESHLCISKHPRAPGVAAVDYVSTTLRYPQHIRLREPMKSPTRVCSAYGQEVICGCVNRCS